MLISVITFSVRYLCRYYVQDVFLAPVNNIIYMPDTSRKLQAAPGSITTINYATESSDRQLEHCFYVSRLVIGQTQTQGRLGPNHERSMSFPTSRSTSQ